MQPVLKVTPAPSLALTIKIRGSDVARIRLETTNLLLADPENNCCDVVTQFAIAADYGMFSFRSGLGTAFARAERLTKLPATSAASWLLRLEGVDFEALRPLAEMLSVLELNEAVIADAGTLSDGFTLDRLKYPETAAPAEFELEYERPLKSA